MTEQDIKLLRDDTDGLVTYEFLANNLYNLTTEELDTVVQNLADVDLSAQYLASSARYLNALDAEQYAPQIKYLAALTIDRDREHRYIGDLIEALYGPDYAANAAALAENDNNFRRMYKRLYPEGAL